MRTRNIVITAIGLILIATIIGSFFLFTGVPQAGIPNSVPYGLRSSSGNVASGFDKTSFTQSGVDRDVGCSPDSGYDTCFAWERTEESGGDAVARTYVQIMANSVPQGVKKGDYYVGEVYIPYKFQGDKYYYAKNVGSWSNLWDNIAKCNEQGCKGTTLPQEGKIILANTGEESKDCIVFYAWDYDRADESDGSWAWVWKSGAWGWNGGAGTCFNIKSVACYEDSDCGDVDTQYCDNTGDWKAWSCKEKTIFYRYDETTNECFSVTLAPSQKTEADYSTLTECETNIKHPEYVYYTIGIIVAILLIVGIVWYLIRRRK
jgi:hypothetical protein